MPRFLAVTASTTTTRRGSIVRAIRAIGGHLTPCALRLREPDRVTQSLTSSVARRRYHARSTARVRRRYARLSSSKRIDRRTRDPASPRRLKHGKNRDPVRLPSVRSSILQSSELVRVHGLGSRDRPAPFRPSRGDASCQESASGTCYPAAASARLSARLACDWEDASYRPLQPTFETSTQGPFGFPSARREPCRPRVTPTEVGIQPRRRATF
jgi:hypothetical protein